MKQEPYLAFLKGETWFYVLVKYSIFYCQKPHKLQCYLHRYIFSSCSLAFWERPKNVVFNKLKQSKLKLTCNFMSKGQAAVHVSFKFRILVSIFNSGFSREFSIVWCQKQNTVAAVMQVELLFKLFFGFPYLSALCTLFPRASRLSCHFCIPSFPTNFITSSFLSPTAMFIV